VLFAHGQLFSQKFQSVHTLPVPPTVFGSEIEFYFFEPIWSPIGHKLAAMDIVTTHFDTEIYILSPEFGLQSWQPTNPEQSNHLVWSPNGNFLAIVDINYQDNPEFKRNIALLDVHSRILTESPKFEVNPKFPNRFYCADCAAPYEIEPIVWANDSRSLYFFSGPDKTSAALSVFRLSDQHSQIIVPQFDEFQWPLPGESLVYLVNQDDQQQIHYLNVETGATAIIGYIKLSTNWSQEDMDYEYRHFYLSPDGQHIVLVYTEPGKQWHVELLSPDGNNKRSIAVSIFPRPNIYDNYVIWSPDSTRFGLNIGTYYTVNASFLDVIDTDGTLQHHIAYDPLDQQVIWTKCGS
jgi:Tol biopolymer transport system component